MRVYWLELLLIAAVIYVALAVPLAAANAADADGDGTATSEDANAEAQANAQAAADETDAVTSDATDIAASEASVLQTGNLRMATSPLGSTIVIQPLDSPDNPYIDQYNEVDRWVYDNLDPAYTSTDRLRDDFSVRTRGLVLQDDNRTADQTVGLESVPNSLARDDAPDPDYDTSGMPDFDNAIPLGAENRLRVLFDENGYLIPQSDPRIVSDTVGVPQTLVQVGANRYASVAAWDAQPDMVVRTNVPVDVNADAQARAQAADSERSARPNVPAAGVKSVSRTNSMLAADMARDSFYVYTAPVPDARLAELRAARIEQVRRNLPQLPSWLAGVNPGRFVLLPGGAVAVDPLDDEATTIVYSPTGERLGAVDSLSSWRTLTMPGYSEVLKRAAAQNLIAVERDGYLLLRDGTSGSVTAVYDWDGTELPAGSALSARPYYFTPLRWSAVGPVVTVREAAPAVQTAPGGSRDQS